MTFSTIPAIEIEPGLRERLEGVLREGETLESFVIASVQQAIEARRIQAEFLAQGEAAWQQYQRTGVSHPVDEVFDRIQRGIDAKRRELLSR